MRERSGAPGRRAEPPRSLRALRRAQPWARRGGPGRAGGIFSFFTEPRPVCPRGKLPRAMRSDGGTRIPVRGGGGAAVPVRQPRGRGEPRSRIPLPRLSLFLRFLSVFRPVPGKRRFRSPAGLLRGASRPPAPVLGGGGCAQTARVCPRCALRSAAAVFELSPCFFFFLPPFLSSLPPSLPPSLSLSPFFPSPSLSHSPAFKDGTASHCVFMYIIRQLVPSTSFASLQYLYKHITLSVACTFCYGCCHSLRDLTFIF